MKNNVCLCFNFNSHVVCVIPQSYERSSFTSVVFSIDRKSLQQHHHRRRLQHLVSDLYYEIIEKPLEKLKIHQFFKTPPYCHLFITPPRDQEFKTQTIVQDNLVFYPSPFYGHHHSSFRVEELYFLALEIIPVQ